MSSVFNSTLEVSLRVLLILETSNQPLTHDIIAAADFITVYGYDFGVAEHNLHGNNGRRYSEFRLRLEIVEEAVKELIVSGLLKVEITTQGFAYSLNELGNATVKKLTTEYATEYRKIVKKSLAYIVNNPQKRIVKEILERSVNVPNGGTNG